MYASRSRNDPTQILEGGIDDRGSVGRARTGQLDNPCGSDDNNEFRETLIMKLLEDSYLKE